MVAVCLDLQGHKGGFLHKPPFFQQDHNHMHGHPANYNYDFFFREPDQAGPEPAGLDITITPVNDGMFSI